jgi:hypothetical protein
MTGRAEGAGSDTYALTAKGALKCMQNTGAAASITLSVADFCQLAASKDKECDGQPPQYV